MIFSFPRFRLLPLPHLLAMGPSLLDAGGASRGYRPLTLPDHILLLVGLPRGSVTLLRGCPSPQGDLFLDEDPPER